MRVAQGTEERPMRLGDEPRPGDDRDERFSVRHAILIWLAAAASGWLVTVGVVYLIANVF